MPRLSVVIPTYNRAAFIGEALQSVALQTAPPLEAIVIDDGSTDDTERRVRDAPRASGIVYRRLPERSGAAVARNLGVELAAGEIVVFLDSDDLLDPQHHARVLEAFASMPTIDVFSCDAHLIDTEGTRLCEGLGYVALQCAIKKTTIRSGPRSLHDIFLFSTPFAGYAIRRDVYRAIGGLRQELFPLEDYDLTLRIAGAGKRVYYAHAPLASYRMHGDNSSGGAKAKAVFTQKQRLRCILDAVSRSSELHGLRVRVRVAEVRRELALTHLKARQPVAGTWQLLRSLGEDPTSILDVVDLTRRKLREKNRTTGPS